MLCPAMFSSNAHFKSSPNPEQRRQRPLGKFKPNPKARLRDQLHEVMRFFHYSPRTEETYWQWIYRYLKFHRKTESRKQKAEREPGGELSMFNFQRSTSSGEAARQHRPTGEAEEVGELSTPINRERAFNIQHSTSKEGMGELENETRGDARPTGGELSTFNFQRSTSKEGDAEREGGWRHPREMGAAEVEAYLSHLASVELVSGATQNQALNALVFLYAEVLHQPLGEIGEFARAQRPARVPVVLSRAEVKRVLAALEKDYALALQLLYGSGLRLMELLRLRVKDMDLERGQIVVRDGKGMKDRVTMAPESLRTALVEHLAMVKAQWMADGAAGYAGVWLPESLARKYPRAPKEWGWQWVFRIRTVAPC